jgi:hypothetical protein
MDPEERALLLNTKDEASPNQTAASTSASPAPPDGDSSLESQYKYSAGLVESDMPALSLADLFSLSSCRGLFAIAAVFSFTYPFGSWEPTYLGERYSVTAVEVGASLGSLSIVSKLADGVMAGVESALMVRGWSTLWIRKSCSSLAYGVSCVLYVLYGAAPSALLATCIRFLDGTAPTVRHTHTETMNPHMFLWDLPYDIGIGF